MYLASRGWLLYTPSIELVVRLTIRETSLFGWNFFLPSVNYVMLMWEEIQGSLCFSILQVTKSQVVVHVPRGGSTLPVKQQLRFEPLSHKSLTCSLSNNDLNYIAMVYKASITFTHLVFVCQWPSAPSVTWTSILWPENKWGHIRLVLFLDHLHMKGKAMSGVLWTVGMCSNWQWKVWMQ